MAYPSKLERILAWSIIAFAFAIPWSSALYRISLFFILVFGAIFIFIYFESRNWKKLEFFDGELYLYLPLAVPCFLSLWITLTWFWTSGSNEFYRFDVSRYTKLWMIPIFAFLISRLLHRRKIIIIYAFALGTLILMVPSYLDYFGLFKLLGLDATKLGNYSYRSSSDRGFNLVYWRNQIVHGLHVSLLFSLALLTSPVNVMRRYFHWLVATACVFDIVFLITGRMALISLCASAITFLALAVPSRCKRILLTTIGVGTGIMMLAFNSEIRMRLMSVWIELLEYFSNSNTQTSAGSRLHYWQISLDLFLQQPFLGTGAGSFRTWLVTTHDSLSEQSHYHAHNEYITQLSEFGLIGLGLFLAMISGIFKALRACTDRRIQGGVSVALVIFCVNALSDSSLHNEWEGWTFVLFSSLAGSYLFDLSKA